MCGACGGEARPVSGGRGSCASACCALRHGGSAIARLPSPPAASASMRFRFGLALRFRKPAALPRGLVASVRSARSSRSSARVRVPPPDAWLASAGRQARTPPERPNAPVPRAAQFAPLPTHRCGKGRSAKRTRPKPICRLASAAHASETALSARSERLGRSATRPVTGTQAYPHPHVPPATCL